MASRRTVLSGTAAKNNLLHALEHPSQFSTVVKKSSLGRNHINGGWWVLSIGYEIRQIVLSGSFINTTTNSFSTINGVYRLGPPRTAMRVWGPLTIRVRVPSCTLLHYWGKISLSIWSVFTALSDRFTVLSEQFSLPYRFTFIGWNLTYQLSGQISIVGVSSVCGWPMTGRESVTVSYHLDQYTNFHEHRNPLCQIRASRNCRINRFITREASKYWKSFITVYMVGKLDDVGLAAFWSALF